MLQKSHGWTPAAGRQQILLPKFPLRWLNNMQQHANILATSTEKLRDRRKVNIPSIQVICRLQDVLS